MTGAGRPDDESAERGSARRYPARPVVGVGAVVLTGERRVILVRRRFEPLAGSWSLPGGGVELGERLEAAIRREVAEETGLAIDVGPLLEIFEPVLHDDAGCVRYHYVIADYLCRAIGGHLRSGSDVGEVASALPDALDAYALTPVARRVIAAGVARAATLGW